ncbi:MAG: methyltransferase [Alphaproteobacteria bacterium]|nr:methyltransferase [Alphaproteobacteria bacterium]MDE2266380.1 methyltransferase [Alphaproteobacteria bacterium]
MTAPESFIRENTALIAPPLVPEVRLHLATEVVPLWRKTEEELEAEGVPPPYWAFAWAGGQALARYVLDHPETVRGKSVLDFGSGSGLVAIAAAKAGASQVLAADIDAFAAAAIALNADANGVPLDITHQDVIGRGGGWQTILVGDMCYERPLAERLLLWLGECVRASAGVTVLLGDPGRTYFPKSGVEKLATYNVQTTRDLEDREIRETSVYRLA